jgi:NusA-like KH domain protein
METTKTFDMQLIRYANLFGRITRIDAKHCFIYNNTVVFVVPVALVQAAIGKDNINLKKMSGIINKRIRVVGQPNGIKDIEKFVGVIVAPIKFEKIEIIANEKAEKEIVISTAGREPKAMLIGRGRARETELKGILEQYFGIRNLRIN